MIPDINTEDIKRLLPILEVGLAFVDREGYFEWGNKKILEMTEYSIVELKKKRFDDITHPEDISTDRELLSMLDFGQIESYEMHKRYITKSGKIINIILVVTKRYANEEDDEHIGYYSQIIPIDEISEKHETVHVNKINFKEFLSENWQWCISAIIAISSVCIVTGTLLYSTANKVNSLQETSRYNQEMILRMLEKNDSTN